MHQSPGPVQFDLTVLLRFLPNQPPRATHSFHRFRALSLYKIFAHALGSHALTCTQTTGKSPKIVENRAACGSRDSSRGRTHTDVYRREIAELAGGKHRLRYTSISEVQHDLRGSLIALQTVTSNCSGPARLMTAAVVDINYENLA
jgi:hypothetical protein